MKQRKATYKERVYCPECCFKLELVISRYGKRYECTGLIDPEYSHQELQPCEYTREFREAIPRSN